MLGQIGFSERSGYTAIGTVCNLAARLCAEAKDGQILVSSPTPLKRLERFREVGGPWKPGSEGGPPSSGPGIQRGAEQ